MDRRTGLVCVCLLLLIAVAFGGSIYNGFVYDDHQLIEDNPLLRDLDPHSHLTSTFWPRGEKATEYYRPLTSWSWAIEWTAGGGSPRPFHLTNLVLHGISSMVLFSLVCALGAGRPVGALAAALFAIHPVQSEAVVWACGRADLLATLLVLAAARLHASVPDTFDRRAAYRALLATTAVSGALLSKEAAVTFPAFIVAVDLARARATQASWPAAFERTARRLMRIGPLYLLALLAYLALRYTIVGPFTGDLPAATSLDVLADSTLATRLMTAVEVGSVYVRLLTWPATLSVDYRVAVVPLVESVGSWAFVRSLVTVAAAALGAGWLARRQPLALFGALAALGSYALMSHLFFPGPVIVAERVLYMPMAGVAALLAAGAGLWARRTRALPVVLLAGLILAAFVVRSNVRVRDWSDDIVLYRATVRATPQSALAWNNLGNELRHAGDAEAAVEAFDRSIAIHPHYLAARLNRADTLRQLNRLDQAEDALRRLLSDHPDHGRGWLVLAETLLRRADNEPRRESANGLRGEACEIALAQATLAQERGDPATAVAFLVLAGESLPRVGREVEAAAALQRAERLARDLGSGSTGSAAGPQRLLAIALGGRAALLANQGQLIPASELFDSAADAAALGDDPTSGERFRAQGRRALRMAAERAVAAEDGHAAIELYDRLIAVGNAGIRAHFGRARARVLVGRLDEARADLQWVLEETTEPRQTAAARTDLARLSLLQGEPAVAREQVDQALEADPAYAPALALRRELEPSR